MMGTASVAETALNVFRAQLDAIQANLDGCLAGTDPIHLHDLRVANRRMRAALEEFKDLLPEEIQAKTLQDYQWIHGITGEVRDLDVCLAHYPEYEREIPEEWRSHLLPLQRILGERRSRAQIVLRENLLSDRFKGILESWAERLDQGVVNGSSVGLEPVREYGCRLIVSRYRKIRKKGPSLTKKSLPEKFHHFRITIKGLRYLMEFLFPSLESEDYTRIRTGLRTVQDAFGAFQDAEVQRERVLELSYDLFNQGASADTLLAMGQLLGRLERKIRRSKKDCLRQIRWLVSDSTARTFQSCFQYPVE